MVSVESRQFMFTGKVRTGTIYIAFTLTNYVEFYSETNPSRKDIIAVLRLKRKK